MRLDDEQIAKLKPLLLEVTGRSYSDVEAHQAGLLIVRFLAAKTIRRMKMNHLEEDENGKQSKSGLATSK